MTSSFYKRVGLVIELFVFALKAAAFLFVSGAVLFSETLHSFADIFDSLFVYIGFRLSRREPDERHPFGYGKETFFWALVTALFMVAVTATLSIVKGVNQLVAPQPLYHVGFGIFSLAVGLIFSLLTLVMGIHVVFKGKKPSWTRFGSYLDPSIKVKIAEDVAAVFGNLLAMAALYLYYITGHLYYDGAAGIIIGLTLAVLGFMIALECKELIIGRSASKNQRKAIERAAESVAGVVRVMDLKTMLMGPDEMLVNIEVNLVDGLNTDTIELLLDEIRLRIEKAVPEARHIQVEVESI